MTSPVSLQSTTPRSSSTPSSPTSHHRRRLCHYQRFVANAQFNLSATLFRELVCGFGVFDSTAVVIALSAVSQTCELKHGLVLHGMIAKKRLDFDVFFAMPLLIYASKSAATVFQFSPTINLCSWNCMISGLTQHKEGRKALEYFHQMENFEPDEMSMVGAVCACTQLALVDMYNKCGRLDIAAQVFQHSVQKSVAFWNAMISTYAFHG
ncbi:hypothetical protein J5N97_010901 [Dioscorea zingiberensis]|uniref:Pentatricopeptide repeat-containing protein n=1 Tax=Dioscorea zingiberensis TaxID=325984 RepID=A0A9D5D008_9LILI|nr:hypothetical protein J5N97_010901 [Dioscorea zingiberensis]